MFGPEVDRFNCCNAELFNGINLFIYGIFTTVKCNSKKQMFDYLAQLLKVNPLIIATIENHPVNEWLRLEIDKKGHCKIFPSPENFNDDEAPF
jgi:hypothetical protein